MKIITTGDGGELACWSSGSGASLLLVHGSISDHTIWDAIRPRLEGRFTVHVVNRRGREGSTPLETVDLEREFRDVADAIGEPVHVLGHSFGADGTQATPADGRKGRGRRLRNRNDSGG